MIDAELDLDRVESACEELGDIFGLYVAPALLEIRENLDGSARAEKIQRWTALLTRAVDRVVRSARLAFDPIGKGEREDDRQARVSAAETRGERIGRIQGAAVERSSRVEIDGLESEVRTAVRAAAKRQDRREAWERALW